MPNVWEKKIPSALKPSASEDKKLRSIPFSHCSDGSNTNTPRAHRFREQRDRRTRTLLHIQYDGGIMWKLGLNKAPVGQSPTGRAIPRNERVHQQLREGNATTHWHAYTLQLSIIQRYYIIMFPTGTQSQINTQYNGKDQIFHITNDYIQATWLPKRCSNITDL